MKRGIFGSVWNLFVEFTLNVLAAILSLVALILLVCSSDSFNDYKILLIIYALQIPLTVIGTDWINSIFED